MYAYRDAHISKTRAKKAKGKLKENYIIEVGTQWGHVKRKNIAVSYVIIEMYDV